VPQLVDLIQISIVRKKDSEINRDK